MDHKHATFINPTAMPPMRPMPLVVTLLLAEQALGDAHILVVGAGGGMETKAVAEARPAWRFTGVDPSPAMLNLPAKRSRLLRNVSI